MEVCTIIAKNYLAHARVLARSLVRHNPGARLWVLIVDDFSGYVEPEAEPFEVLTPADVGCEPFPHMALRYTVLEISTAVKPWLLRHLMATTGGPVTYLDPDIEVYGSLAALDRAAAEHGVAVIPHNNVPVPADDHRPSQVDIMIAGIYNLGYVSLAPRPEVDRILDWWEDRLRRDCRVDPLWGYFVDQRWFDLVPGLVSDLAIIRDPEYNVAYWNLHSRRLEFDGSRYLVDGRPLAFFHFSGFDPERPRSLSRHQSRIDVSAHPVLERLLAEYAREVMDAGHAVSRRWPYTYTTLGDGTEIDELIRSLSDEFEDELERRGASVPSPFTAAGARAFREWLGEDAPGRPRGINRVLAHVYDERADLKRAYPDLSGHDREGLLGWAKDIGSREIPLLARVTPGRNGGERAPEPISDRLSGQPWGVNVVGYFGADSESGEIARQLVGAFDAGGIPAVPVQAFSSPSALEPAPFQTVSSEAAPYLVNIFCVPPGAVDELAATLGHRFFAGRYSIAVWLEDVAPSPQALELLQEIWAPNQHLASRVAQQTAVPVLVIPLPVEPAPFDATSRRQVGLPEDKWLFLAEVEGEHDRPSGLIEAFRRAFPAGEAVALAIVAPAAAPSGVGEPSSQADGGPLIQLLEAPVERAGRLALKALCDTYISWHRRETVGMAIAEAMWLGKPVIATASAGDLGFVASSNVLLVRSEAKAAGAEPDLDHAAALMRGALDDPAAARALGARAATDVQRDHAPAASGQAIRIRLESIRSTGQVPRWLAHRPARSTAAGRVHQMVTVGPPATAREGPAHRLRTAVRSGLLRLLRPYSAYQHRVNVGLVDALQDLGASAVGDPQEQASPERAELLAELRGARQLRRAVEVQARAIDEVRRIVTLQSDRGLYLALAELAERHARVASTPGEPAPVLGLSGYELRAYSQNGEDGVLAEILRRIGAHNHFFVEFGVESGVEGNCVYLADVAGWRGLFMEANDQMYRLLDRKYAPRAGIHTRQALVTPDNIDQLLSAADVPQEPDVISIDVDGSDYWIWEAIESRRPRVVVIEYNSALDPRRRLVQPRGVEGWNGTDYFGASLGAIRSLGERKGYRLVHTELAGSNAFLVRSDLAGDRFPEPDEVPLRGIPNYFQSGYRHPSDESDRRYLDLDTGEMVSITR